MNRHALICCIGISACFSALGCSGSKEPPSEGAADAYQEGPGRLSVTIWPKMTRVKIDEPFYITLRVVNSTEKSQSLKVWTAGWDANWKCSNPRILFVGGILGNSTGNTVERISLEPGEAYEKKAQIAVQKGPMPVITSFQMGFTQQGDKKTHWSNRVVVGIKPGKRE